MNFAQAWGFSWVLIIQCQHANFVFRLLKPNGTIALRRPPKFSALAPTLFKSFWVISRLIVAVRAVSLPGLTRDYCAPLSGGKFMPLIDRSSCRCDPFEAAVL